MRKHIGVCFFVNDIVLIDEIKKRVNTKLEL